MAPSFFNSFKAEKMLLREMKNQYNTENQNAQTEIFSFQGNLYITSSIL